MAIFKSWKLTKNKALDVDIHFITPSRTESSRLCLGFETEVSYNCDHAGAALHISLVFVWFNVCFYDIRHWDDETNTWEKEEVLEKIDV